jgi:DNA-binding MarR family transcriptional regulator
VVENDRKKTLKLTPEAQKLHEKLRKEYGIEDSGGLLILQTAFEAFDRMRAAQRAILQTGMSFTDRFNQLKANPLLTIERDARAQYLAALKMLNLDTEPSQNGPGRPPG